MTSTPPTPEHWSPGSSPYSSRPPTPSTPGLSADGSRPASPVADTLTGWDLPPAQSYPIPPGLERMGFLDLPPWLKDAEGSATVDYKAGMRLERPKLREVKFTSAELAGAASKPTAEHEAWLREKDHRGAEDKEPCFSWTNRGECKLGKRCRFLHEGFVPESSDSEAGYRGKSASLRKKEEEGGAHGYQAKWGGMLRNNTAGGTGSGIDADTKAGCLVHGGSIAPDRSPPSVKGSGKNWSAISRRGRGNQTKSSSQVCRFYKGRGCRFGDRCRDLHL